jgi:hypothetical protein
MGKYKEKIETMLKNDPKCLDTEMDEYNLIGDKNFRMNTVYSLELKGADLVTALSIVDDLVAVIKKQNKAK